MDDDLPEEMGGHDSNTPGTSGSPVEHEAKLHGSFPSSSALDKGAHLAVLEPDDTAGQL